MVLIVVGAEGSAPITLEGGTIQAMEITNKFLRQVIGDLEEVDDDVQEIRVCSFLGETLKQEGYNFIIDRNTYYKRDLGYPKIFVMVDVNVSSLFEIVV